MPTEQPRKVWMPIGIYRNLPFPLRSILEPYDWLPMAERAQKLKAVGGVTTGISASTQNGDRDGGRNGKDLCISGSGAA